MSEPVPLSGRRFWQQPWLLAVAVGVVAGIWVGATSRGFGSVYTTLFLGGGLTVFVVCVLIGSAVVALGGRNEAARALFAFAVAAPTAAVLAYELAPPYRSPDAPVIHDGAVDVVLDGPTELAWHADATCRVDRGASAASAVWAPDVKVGERWVAVLVRLDAGPSVGQATIAFSSPTGGADYSATTERGLAPLAISPDGLRGSVRLSAPRVPVSGRPSPAPDDQIAGTVEWACR